MADKRDVERRQKSQIQIKQSPPNYEGKIHRIEDIGQYDFAFTLARVSSDKQKKHLKHQQDSIAYELDVRGIRIIDTFDYVGQAYESFWLEPTIEKIRFLCKVFGRIWLVAETVCRLKRNEYYHSVFRPDAVATDKDIEDLLCVTKETPLAVLHLSSSSSENRSMQIKRGMNNSQNKPGRRKNKYPGYKIDQKKEYFDLAVRMNKEGNSLSSIADFITMDSGYEISSMTIHNWLKISINKDTECGNGFHQNGTNGKIVES